MSESYLSSAEIGNPRLRSLPRGITTAREEELNELFSAMEADGSSTVDGSAVAALDTDGLALLCKGMDRLRRTGQPVIIHNPSPTLIDARRALRLEDAMPFEPEVPDDSDIEVRDRMGEILIDLGFLTQEKLDEAIEKTSERQDARLGTLLIEEGFVNEEHLAKALAVQYSLPYLSPVQNHILDVSLEHHVPFTVLRSNGILPLLSLDGVIAVAVRDPSNVYATDAVRDNSGLTVAACVASSKEIDKGLDLLQRAAAARGERTNTSNEFSSVSVEERLDQVLLDSLIEGASDIHIEPDELYYHLRFRVDGRLRRSCRFSIEDGNSLVARIKVLAECDISEKRQPQDGRIHFKRGERDVDLRVSTLPTVNGEKAVMRVLDRKAGSIPLPAMGLTEENLGWLRDGITSPYGMVLVTGPTGSGKTTTLYSVLDEIVSPEVNISTVENPVERAVKNVNQTQINVKAGMTFAGALRALLRQDPDVIMIGEIRDKETAEIAVEAALTGHLVLATLHTNDAPGAATRMIQMGVEPFLVSATLRTVVAQRLVRRICESCKHEIKLPDEVIQTYREFGITDGPHYTGSGCASCRGQGYEGRLGIYEVMDVNETLRDMIAINPATIDLQRKAVEEGMKTLQHDAVRYANEGMTSLEEALRAAGAV